MCQKEFVFGVRQTRVPILPLPSDLGPINLFTKTPFPHLKMEIVLSFLAVVRNKQGQVL